MDQQTARPSASLKLKWVPGGLVILAAVVFALGIDWGLPSHNVDPILFGTGSQSATQALDSYHLTGVGINRLAGSWDENANLGADVAAHPILDRSQPVTLLQNPYVATAQDLVRQGDQTAAALVDAMQKADAEYARDRAANNQKSSAARPVAVAAQQKLARYVADYNAAHGGEQKNTIAQDDVNRARILRRYRLYSYQPDEMISFRALAMMHPGKMQFDPKLYQYGGLWIYPLGAIIKAASTVGYVETTSDTTFYLDSPDQFGRFYILARAYSVLWGIIGTLAVYAIMRRAGVGWGLSALAAICFIFLPVVVDLAHEAKPHLAGCSLMLLAVLAAQHYVETGKWKWAIWTGIACGASAGMILWGVVSLFILPMMILMRREEAGKRIGICVAGIVAAVVIYFASNPYVAVHLLGDRSVLDSNLGNTEAMYGLRPDIVNTLKLAIIGMSWPIAAAGLIGIIALVTGKAAKVGWLLLVPAAFVLLEFFEHSGGKPGEYARFAVFADVALMLVAFLAIANLPAITARIAIGSVFVIAAAVYSFSYERGFWSDSFDWNSRMKVAATLDAKRPIFGEPGVLYVLAEPAPYSLPPINLFHWQLILLPPGGRVLDGSVAGKLVKPDDSYGLFDPSDTPISWAAKRFDVVDVGGK